MPFVNRRRPLQTTLVVLGFLSLIVGLLVMVGGPVTSHHSPVRAVAPDSIRPAPAQPSPEPSRSTVPPEIRLVSWRGRVEQLFFHPLVLRPKLAFTDDPLGHGFLDFSSRLESFGPSWTSCGGNGWTLVDVYRAAAGNVRVPVGRKPLVLFEDDVNYYTYLRW